jgi:AraC-like DNA-binding protein
MHADGSTEFERFGDWSEAICDFVMDVSARRPPGSEPFSAAITSTRLGGARMSRFRSAPHGIVRDAARIRRSQSDDYLVSFQRAGRTMVSCGARRFVQHPGEIVVVDAARPFLLEFPDPVERQVARIPRHLFAAGTGFDRLDDGLHLSGGTLPLRLLRHLFVEMGEEAADNLPPGLVIDLCRLLKGAAGTVLAVPPRSGLWRRVHGLVEDRLTDPDLSLDTAAEGLSVSARTVQREFSRRGTTFRSYLLNRRLEAIADQLRDARFAECAVTTIALRWGFNDPAHFSRAFRRRYAMSPTQFRAGISDR